LGGGLPGFNNLGRPHLGGGIPNLQALTGNLGGLGGRPNLAAQGLPHGALQAGLLRPMAPGLMRPLGIPTSPGMHLNPMAIGAATSKAGAPAVVPLAPKPAGAPCTVYVGRISTEVSDDFVKQLLEKCGKISKWNRAADPNTSKLTSFGFCDFEDPQGVWRALEFLHEKQLCDKRLLVKCEEKAKQTIETWKASRKEELLKKKREEAASGDKEAKDKAEGKEDEKDSQDDKKPKAPEEGKNGDVKKAAAIVDISTDELELELKNESKELEETVEKLLKEKNKGYPEVKLELTTEEKEKEGKEDDKADKGKEGEKAEKTDKGEGSTAKDKSDDKEEKENKSSNDKKEEPSGRHRDNNDRDRDNRDRRRSPEPRLTREEERKRRIEEEKKAPVSRHYRPSRRERDREQRVRDRERDIEKEYQYRIREFERGEESRIKSLKRDLRDLEREPDLSEREKRKYIDRDIHYGQSEVDEREWKRHREERRESRLREIEKDCADRLAEQKEIEEERRKREEEDRRRRKEEDERKRKEREAVEADRRRVREEERAKREAELRKQQEEIERKRDDDRKRREAEQKKQQEAAAAKLMQSVQEQMMRQDSTPDKGSRKESGGLPPTGVQAMFRDGNNEDLDEKGNPRKHRPLTRLDGPPQGEVRLRDDEMRRLIQQVPTDKQKAFAYDIDWDAVVDHNIIEKKLRPWVKKKVTEYLGAEESGMIDFIMRKVGSRTKPDAILRELEGFLDEEAANFTLKMWRMLIFEVLRVKAR